jgi:hypothetical protein
VSSAGRRGRRRRRPTTLLRPRRGVVGADGRQAVGISSRARRDELQEVRDHVHIVAFAAREFDDAEHLDVLFDDRAT